MILPYSFTQKTSLILWTSTHLTLKLICPCNTAKNISDLTSFLTNMFLFGVRKNIWTTLFLEAQEMHSWSNLKANISIFLYISLKKYFFKDLVRLYLMGWNSRRMNNFLKTARCLDLAKCFKIRHFDFTFWKLNIF